LVLQVKRIKRQVSGVLLLDKPHGITSNAALQQAKHLYQAAKAGHTGNLDPIATGLLPVCLGEATKFSQFLLDANKTYQAVFTLGQTTSTGDAEGEVVSRHPVSVTRKQVETVLKRFVGQIEQVPPMHSAIKFQGRALYTYARAGVEIERAARKVTIYSLILDGFEGDTVRVTVECSKGTYIRVLAEDVGRALGCGAFMQALRRIRIGGFDIGQAVTLPQLESMSLADRDSLLLPADCLVEDMPRIELDADSAYYVRQGQSVWMPKQKAGGLVRLYDEKQTFIGLGQVGGDGKVAPKRLVVQ
jgi:tRNA pseudouridine55 synthase